MKVAKGPRNAAAVGELRVTIGESAFGQSFCRIDEWKTMAELRKRLSQPWTGDTCFGNILRTPAFLFQRPLDR